VVKASLHHNPEPAGGQTVADGAKTTQPRIVGGACRRPFRAGIIAPIPRARTKGSSIKGTAAVLLLKAADSRYRSQRSQKRRKDLLPIVV